MSELDFVTGLRQDLVEAAARQQQHSPAARAARPLHPRLWSPAVVLGAATALVAVLVVVLGLRAVGPAPEPTDAQIVDVVRIGGQPRDAIAVGGTLVVVGYDARVRVIRPGEDRARELTRVTGTPVSLTSEGAAVWVLTADVAGNRPRSLLQKFDVRSGKRLATVPVDGAATTVAAGAGGLWLLPSAISRNALRRIDGVSVRRTRTAGGAGLDGLAVTERSVWVRAGTTIVERDAAGRVRHRTHGISPTIAFGSPRSMLPDAAGAWVVGQAGGLLYRIERGRVIKRVKIGQTAGVVGRSGATVWVSATSSPGSYELVGVDGATGRVTGRVPLGSKPPQAVVPIGKQVWVVTSGGDALLVDPE
jgi:hypothetical protein